MQNKLISTVVKLNFMNVKSISVSAKLIFFFRVPHHHPDKF